MGLVMEMFTQKPKGLRIDPRYMPRVGETCLVSGPHCDDGNGYAWGKTTVLWLDETFVLYGNKGFWPSLYKLDHVLFKPMAL